MPILVGDRAIGVISVQSIDEAGRFGDDEKRLLSTLAANVGVAIQNARLYRDSQRRAGEMAALVDVASEISAMLDLRPVIERIAERARTLLGGDTSGVFLADAEGRTYPALVALGSLADEVMAIAIEPGQGILGDLVAPRGGRGGQRHHRPTRGRSSSRAPRRTSTTGSWPPRSSPAARWPG